MTNSIPTAGKVHMRRLNDLSMILLLTVSVAASRAVSAPPIVENGEPNAEIVVAEQPPRTTMLAAEELQRYIEKISGAVLPVHDRPTKQMPVQIYVGVSPHTDRLGVTDQGLKHGAYRVVSGDDWLVLLGRDRDYAPVGLFARNHGDWQHRVGPAWEAKRGPEAENPYASTGYKRYNRELDLWAMDERGSFNAVTHFLRNLGVRWYMPGELGQIVPKRQTIALPDVDRTVRPNIAWRMGNLDRIGQAPREDVMWRLRLNFNYRHGGLPAHGLYWVTPRHAEAPMLDLHPEYYALYNGRRARGHSANQCLSSFGLFAQTVNYARSAFDHHEFPWVSIMPSDGFTSVCECPRCEGEATPGRGYRGRSSDYVWSFVDRVAKAIERTHPDKHIVGEGYNTYMLPPRTIDKLNDNVFVKIKNGRRRRPLTSEEAQQLAELREGWLEKSNNKLLIGLNWRREGYVPAYLPRVVAIGIQKTRDITFAEGVNFAWRNVTGPTDLGLRAPIVNHLDVYVTSRFYWDAEQDVDELLAEYYDKFYGPAADAMERFIEYCETHFRTLGDDEAQIAQALAFFEQAWKQTDAGSVYAKRLALLDEFLTDLRNRRRQLAKAREPKVTVQALPMDNRKFQDAGRTLELDGRLDEAFWREACRYGFSSEMLKDTQTGRAPGFSTRVCVAWMNGSLYMGIRCNDRPGGPAKSATDEDDSPAIWRGDAVEILLETDAHAYYQIAISPSGAVTDLDRRDGKRFRWSSQAEVATHVGKDFWSVELRIPVKQTNEDPLHQVRGNKPTERFPWYFNVGRQRIREGNKETSLLSPTGKKGFHHPQSFAKLYVR